MTLDQALLDLQELARRLRRDCPWDRVQTAATIVPHTVEDVPAMHRLMPALDEKDEQIEIAGDEGPLAPALDEHPAPRRKDEIAEAIARHSLRDRSHVIVTDEMAVPLTSPAFAALRVRGPQAVEQFQHNAPMDFSLGTPRPNALDTVSGRTS